MSAVLRVQFYEKFHQHWYQFSAVEKRLNTRLNQMLKFPILQNQCSYQQTHLA